MNAIYAPEALLPAGWAREVIIEIDDRGDIVSTQPDRPQGAQSMRAGR